MTDIKNHFISQPGAAVALAPRVDPCSAIEHLRHQTRSVHRIVCSLMAAAGTDRTHPILRERRSPAALLARRGWVIAAGARRGGKRG